MKKVFGIIFAAVLAIPAFAQDYLPKAGEWNVQIGMDPKALVMGGGWSDVGGFSAGYMVTDNIGVRATLGLDVKIWNKREYAPDDAAVVLNAFSKEKVVDTRKYQSLGGSVSLGVDYHVGSAGKVQGVFGAGLMYGFKGMDQYTYTYGNAITEYNQLPTTYMTDPDGNSVWDKFAAQRIDGAAESAPKNATGIDAARILRQYSNAGDDNLRQMVGLYLSAGIEWFVAPKLALGLNASINILYEFMHAYTTEYEGWNTIDHQYVKWIEKEKPMENGFRFSTADSFGTKIYMSVYL
jgi:hypothetical protein